MAQVPSRGGEAGPLTNCAQPQETIYKRDDIVNVYEAELKKARHWARVVGFLHILSQFLAFCNLTWATVALLGAFLDDLAPRDFGFVTSLLFIEAGRLASASFFLRFLMRPLAYLSQNPENIKHCDDAQYPATLRVRQSSYFAQCLLIVPGLVVPILGHIFLRSYSNTNNLSKSLRIFYSFVAFNSLVALINLICSIQAFRVLNNPPEQSILRYFDTVLEKAISSDLLRADVFEFFSFAYTILGADFRRNVQPEAVAKNHKRLIHYLNAHRQGVDALETHIDAQDPFVQLAAVNMVGFWADRAWGVGVPEKERNLSEGLLTKLADKVGTGQLGWAATTSFSVLAGTQKGVQIVERTRTSRDIRLLDWVVRQVDDSSNRSLALVRMLVNFYEQKCVNEVVPPKLCEQDETLMGKLEKLAEESRVLRLKVIAAYLLFIMSARVCNEDVVLGINIERSNYWFSSEMRMLELLRSRICPDAPPLEKHHVDVRPDTDLTVPLWARPRDAAASQL